MLGSTPVCIESQIRSQIFGLRSTLSGLHEIVEKIEIRLSPIVNQQSKQRARLEPEKEMKGVPLADELLEIRKTVCSIVERMETLLEDIDL